MEFLLTVVLGTSFFIAWYRDHPKWRFWFRQFSKLFKHSQQVIYITDQNGRIFPLEWPSTYSELLQFLLQRSTEEFRQENQLQQSSRWNPNDFILQFEDGTGSIVHVDSEETFQGLVPITRVPAVHRTQQEDDQLPDGSTPMAFLSPTVYYVVLKCMTYHPTPVSKHHKIVRK